MKAMIFLIILFSMINISFALYLIASGAYPEGFRGLSLVVAAPVLLSSLEGYVYSDQEYLFLGTRKLTVPIKEIAKVEIIRRKLGMGYTIGLTDCRGAKTKLAANELLKDKFIEFIGKYDAGITIYD
ncbi:MAG TPA: hypothetical protein VHT96_03860 [Clostridia bacterium]|nr:hypothetical protein [Clostridia bacterium]